MPAGNPGMNCAAGRGHAGKSLTDDRGQKVAVVIPIADYESLTEDVGDYRVYIASC